MFEAGAPMAPAMFDAGAPSVQLRTREPRQALDELFARDVHHVLLEGGPRLAAAFVRAGLVDGVVWYVAPALLGAGPAALSDAGMSGIGDALRLRVLEVRQVGADVRIDARVQRLPAR